MSDPSLPWLAAAFAVAWLIIGAYLYRLSRAQRDIDRRIAELDERTGRRGSGSPPASG